MVNVTTWSQKVWMCGCRWQRPTQESVTRTRTWTRATVTNKCHTRECAKEHIGRDGDHVKKVGAMWHYASDDVWRHEHWRMHTRPIFDRWCKKIKRNRKIKKVGRKYFCAKSFVKKVLDKKFCAKSFGEKVLWKKFW